MGNLNKHVKFYGASVSTGILYTVFVIVVSFITTPYILDILEKKDFAYYSLAREVIFWMGILFLGQRSGFKMQVAGNYNQPEKVNQLYTSFLATQFIIALIAIVIGVFISHFFYLIKSSSANMLYYDRTIILLTLAFSITVVSSVFSIILSVYNKDYSIFIAKILFHALQTVIMVFLLKSGMKTVALAASILFFELAMFIYLVVLVKKLLVFLKFDIKLFSWKIIKYNFKIGSWVLLGFIGQLLIRHTDLFLVTEFVGLSTVTFFILSSKLYLTTYSLIQVVVNITFSQQMRLFKNDIKLYRQLSLAGMKLFIMLLLAMGVSIYMLNYEFIKWWVGPEYFLGPLYNFIFFSIFIVQSMNLVLRSVSNASLKSYLYIKYDKMILLAEGIVNVALSILLGYWFSVYGILYATLVSSFVASVFFLWPHVNTVFKKNIAYSVLMQPSVWYLSIGMAIMFFMNYAYPASLNLTNTIGIVLMVWVIGCYYAYQSFTHLKKLMAI